MPPLSRHSAAALFPAVGAEVLAVEEQVLAAVQAARDQPIPMIRLKEVEEMLGLDASVVSRALRTWQVGIVLLMQLLVLLLRHSTLPRL